MRLFQNPVLYLAQQMWRYSKGRRHVVLLFFGMFTSSNVISFLEPLIVARLLNIIQEQGITEQSMPAIVFTIGLFLAQEIAFWLFHGPARVIEISNSFWVRKNFKEYLLKGTMDLPADWHANHHSGDTIDKIEKASNSLFTFSNHTFEILDVIIRLVSSYIALTYFNIHSSYIVLFMVIATVTIVLKFDSVLRKQYRELYKAENTISAKVYDIISNITTVIILRIEKLVLTSIVKKIIHMFPLFKRNNQVNEVKWFLVSLSTAIMTCLVLFTYIYPHYAAGTTIMAGSLYILYGYVQRISEVFYRFAYMYNDIVRQQAAVQNIEPIIQEFDQKKKVREVAFPKKWGTLDIHDLRFSYHTKEGADLHLDGISLTLRQGEKIALIGESGSGKTTLLKMMRGLYEPQHVQVRLGEKNLPHGFLSVSSAIALIPQDPEIFNTTIKENITVGVPHTLSFIRRFTNMAEFTDVVKNLPKQWDSSIVEKGVNLSGGQKQRLALARGLMAGVDKEILLLDEPTSSVDAKNELAIYENIFKKFKKKTIVSTIHRLHLLPLFDRIVFFSDGKIIADGTFDEVLKHSEEFQLLWRKYQGATTFVLPKNEEQV